MKNEAAGSTSVESRRLEISTARTAIASDCVCGISDRRSRPKVGSTVSAAGASKPVPRGWRRLNAMTHRAVPGTTIPGRGARRQTESPSSSARRQARARSNRWVTRAATVAGLVRHASRRRAGLWLWSDVRKGLRHTIRRSAAERCRHKCRPEGRAETCRVAAQRSRMKTISYGQCRSASAAAGGHTLVKIRRYHGRYRNGAQNRCNEGGITLRC